MAGGVLGNARLAFQYLRQFPEVVPVVGIEKAEEMKEIVALYECPPVLASDDLFRIESLKRAMGSRFCRRCDYCQPCPAGIDISSIMNLPALMKRYPPERLYGRDAHRLGVDNARDCSECNDCENRCPYHLPIRDLLREIVAAYDQARNEYLGACPI
jgi:predicted aldo/keto reductase-like oxidoreductase